MNNQNQEAFIVITISYILQVFLLCLLRKILFLNTDPKNQMILFLFC